MFMNRKLLLYVNRFIYIAAAAMLAAGLLLTVVPQPAKAVADTCVCHQPPSHNSVVCTDDNGVLDGHLNHDDYIVTTQAEIDYCLADNDIPPVLGCTDPEASNYDPAATLNDGSCIYPAVPGCTDPTAFNYNPAATEDDGSCVAKCQYNESIAANDPACIAPVSGCTDPTAFNYNPAATVNDGSCVAKCQYNESIAANDPACIAPIPGCTNPTAFNYNPAATVNDGSCVAKCQYNQSIAANDPACVPPVNPILGCTDPDATNYNASATLDDGSCTYPDGGITPTLAPPAVAANAALIPVTGIKVTFRMNNFVYSGLGLLGIGLVLSAYRRKMDD